MFLGVPDELAVPALVRASMFTLVFLLAVLDLRYRWRIAGAALGVVLLNLQIFVGGTFLLFHQLSVLTTTALALLLVEHMRVEPRALRDLLASKEADWAVERHDLLERVAVANARATAAEKRLNITD